MQEYPIRNTNQDAINSWLKGRIQTEDLLSFIDAYAELRKGVKN